MRTLVPPRRILILATAVVSLSVTASAAQDRATVLDGNAEATAIDVRGTERMAWDQRASSADELSGLGFLAYVNGRVQWLYSVSCAFTPTAAGFECTAALPVLDPGVNVVEVAAYQTSAPTREGERSPAMYLRSGSSATAAASRVVAQAPDPAVSTDRTWSTADGIQLRATNVAAGLEDSTDLLPLADGRVLIAERAGRVRVFRDGALAAAPALILDDVEVGDGRGLLALAADRAFATTGHVFAVYSTADGLRVARFTVAGDTLVDRAILLDGLPAAAVQPAALLRTGPDGRLYLALDDGGDPQSMGDQGSYSGKVLRLAVDGTTPPDQPGSSPVWSIGVSHPVGLAWSPDAALPRLIGIESPESSVAGADLDAGAALARLSVTPEVGATRAAIGGGSSLPALQGHVIVASDRERAILRVRLAGDRPADVDWLLTDLPGPATAIAVAPDGAIFVAVGATLVRIGPQ